MDCHGRKIWSVEYTINLATLTIRFIVIESNACIIELTDDKDFWEAK